MSSSSPSPREDRYTLYGAPGSGATPIHAALTLIGAQVETVEIFPWESEAERERMSSINPMRQVPALVLPSGEVMTESAAILIWLGDRYPEAQLCPAPDDPLRARYLRWMVYLPAAIYSMFWVRDEPSRLVPDPAAQAAMLERTAETLTDGLRSLLLEREGYATKLFEFISVEHTPKNNMLVGTRLAKPPSPDRFDDEIRTIKEFYGIEHQRLETLLRSSKPALV